MDWLGSGFMPHGHCYLWRPEMVWLQVLSNLAIGLAYMWISGTLWALVRRARDLPFQWVYVAFGVFIVACGFTHFFDVVTVWKPVYWLDGGVRLTTAIASVGTAVLIIPLFPKAIALADTARLAHSRGLELEQLNRELATVATHTRATMAEALPHLVWTMNARGVVEYVNARFAELTGLSLDAAAARGWTEAVAEVDRAAAEAAWSEALAAGRPFEGEYRMCRHPGGKPAWYLVRAVPLRGPDGGVLQWFATGTDIDARRRIESDLRESEERFRAIADNIPPLAWIADETGWIGWYNRRWFDYTGTTLDEMAGWGWQKVHHPAYVEAVTEKFKRHVASGEPWEDTFPLRSKDGEYRWFLSRANPIRDERGRVVRWFGTNTDVTEQREARASLERLAEDLRETVKARDDFLSIASHELKTPLSSLKLQNQSMQRKLQRGDPSACAPERVQRLVDQTEKQIDRLTRLVDDMLDVARIRGGRLSIAREHVALEQVVREVVERFAPAMAEAGTPVAIARCDHVEGEWDRFRLEQVLTNLLTNAMRYGDAKPVTVELARVGDVARLVVRDQGRGIEPGTEQRIFDRFERAISASEVSGLGLGLFISQQIVAAHGGRIWAESEGLGRGAAFFVELPCSA